MTPIQVPLAGDREYAPLRMAFPGARGALIAALVVGAALFPNPVLARQPGHTAPGQARKQQAAATAAATAVAATASGVTGGHNASAAPAPAPTPTPAGPVALALPAAPVPTMSHAAALPLPVGIAPAPVALAPPPLGRPTIALPRPVAEAVPTPPPAPANPAFTAIPDGAKLVVTLPAGKEGQRLSVVLFLLPLLFVIWFWALLRGMAAGWAMRGYASRSAIAQQLGLRTTQLAALAPEDLMRLRDGIAFDELTGVLRRAAGLAALDRELARGARTKRPVSVVFIDVDGLKSTNDSLGHAAGDALLRRVSRLLTRRLRAQDLVFRYGGDEFVAVMPDTSRPRAEAIAGEMRRAAGADGVPFSLGVAQARPEEAARALIARADSLQYLDKQARRRGR